MNLDQYSAIHATRDELSNLFESSPAGPVPSGRGRGTALVATGTAFASPVNAIVRSMFWRGKRFNDRTGRLENLLTPFEMPLIAAAVYEGTSLVDDKPCIVLDYSQTSLLASQIRDEIREVSPGNYLGVVFVGGRRVPVEFWLNFSPSEETYPAERLRFILEERPIDWAATAPIQLERKIEIPAAPEAVFALLADHEAWSDWYRGMQRVRVDSPTSGVGTRRTVWIGPTRVHEHFLLWQDNQRLVFSILESNVPGLRAMQEDWRLSPSESGTTLTISIGVEASGPLQSIPGIVKSIIARSTRGASEISGAFQRE